MSRAQFRDTVREGTAGVVELARRLVAIPSGYPPGDTGAVAATIADLLEGTPGMEVECHQSAAHVQNLVVRVRGHAPGRRIVFNGHLDTFPLDPAARWTADPAGEVRDGRLYGLGVSDMKGGVAASLFALRMLAAHRDLFTGEAVGTFAGDEESMGVLGTQFLLDTVPHARGDAMISADAGSLLVLRFGEKGMLWLRVTTRGRSAHAAHVHRGDSAIDRLLTVLQRLAALRRWPVDAPPAILAAIAAASPVSEALSGAGESEVLRSVTVTFGTLQGGILSNLVADAAEATVDIRLPAGVTVAAIEAEIARIAADDAQVGIEIIRRYEPSWTPPDHEVVRIVQANTGAVLGMEPAVTMRVGASDARLYRRAGVPSVVCGLTPHNMGAADEYVEVAELTALAEILALSGLDFLSSSVPSSPP
jgi:succinyl-diaminopimelate desuccinylase